MNSTDIFSFGYFHLHVSESITINEELNAIDWFLKHTVSVEHVLHLAVRTQSNPPIAKSHVSLQLSQKSATGSYSDSDPNTLFPSQHFGLILPPIRSLSKCSLPSSFPH